LHAKALLARSVWNDDDESALEGSRLAESLGIPALRSYARLARINVLWSQGRTDGLWDLLQEWLTLSSERSDPDAQADALMGASQIYLEYGKIPESRGTTDRLGEVVAGLTPHHRIHGLAQRVLLESSLACWEKVVELSREVERAVEANVATPCPLNAASLFYCALANANVGDGEEAARLEIKAYDLGMEGYGSIVDPPRLRLAVTRGRLDEARQILDLEREPGMSPWTQLAFAARFDGLAAVGDTTRLEEEAPLKFGTGMYSEPFALRALGIVQADRSLIERAAELFDGMTLDRLARETRHVAAGLGLPG
jgi:hypothetical protein